MSSKKISSASPVASVRKVVLVIDVDPASLVTLRVKPDRRQVSTHLPDALERRVGPAEQPASK